MMQQASLNIGTIGQKLEAARQAKGVSVSQAGRETKILSRFIEAMEADDFGALTAPVYAKSFIKMYAQYLGLDARPLVDEYVAQQAPRGKASPPEDLRQGVAAAGREPAADEPRPAAKARPGNGKKIFGGANVAMVRLSGSAFPLKTVLAAVAGALLLALVVFAATQCADDRGKAPAPAGGAAAIQRDLLLDAPPDAYLLRPGVVEVGR